MQSELVANEDLYREAERAQQLTVQLFERAQAAGVIRPELAVDDLTFLFEQLADVRAEDEERTRQLRLRYLALLLDGMRPSSGAELPGPKPSWDQVRARWRS